MKLGHKQKLILTLAQRKEGIKFQEIAELYGESNCRGNSYPKTRQVIKTLEGLGLLKQVTTNYPQIYIFCNDNNIDLELEIK